MTHPAGIDAWIRTQNRGVPPWSALSERARRFWRRAYAQRREGTS